MVMLPVGVGKGGSETPYGLALMGTAWLEAQLVNWASAIEDVQLGGRTEWKRTLLGWRSCLEMYMPVLSARWVGKVRKEKGQNHRVVRRW